MESVQRVLLLYTSVVEVEGFASLGSLHGEHQTKGKWNRLSVKD